MDRNNVDKNRRVVITGLGVVSSLGIGWQEFWKNLIAGKSGISRISAFDTSSYDRHYGGEVKGFDPAKFINIRKSKRLGRASQMAIVAGKLAMEDARLRLDLKGRGRAGVCIGTTMGEPQIMEKVDEKSFSAGGQLEYDFNSTMHYPPNSIPSNVAHQFKLKRENILFSTACASGNYAVARSFDLIKSGRCDFMLAGGADSLSRIAFTGFGRLFVMAPEKCQPFDKNRQGMLLGEGSGMVVLETFETAKKRKAPIYAEVLGYGLSCDAYHMTNPSVEGVAKAIKKALKDSSVTPDEVDYISAHGTGTKENDEAECRAINRVFGKRAKDIPVSSIKSMLGHTMGAATALETIACCLAVKDGKVPPTINHKKDDPACNIDCVPNKSRKHAVRVALNSSQAFGGNNSCIIVKEIYT